MPTAGRLAGAIAFAAFGFVLAYLTTPFFEEGRQPSFWYALCIGAGLWAGWVVLGKRTGLGYTAGTGNGITAAVAMVFWIVFLLSFNDMITKAFRKSYDDPVAALVDVFAIMGDYAVQFADPQLGIVTLGGGVIGGWFAEFFAKRFP